MVQYNILLLDFVVFCVIKRLFFGENKRFVATCSCSEVSRWYNFRFSLFI